MLIEEGFLLPAARNLRLLWLVGIAVKRLYMGIAKLASTFQEDVNMTTVTTEILQTTQTADFVKLFEYVLAVSKELGEQKAWSILEYCVTRRRRKWLELLEQSEFEGTAVEHAYELFLLRYLRIHPDQVPIVEKTENKIVYRSYNFCPVLEACKVLELDTRKVCKNVYERPTQAFLSWINPNLRFVRNYERIRPYAKFCEEVIKLEK